jgi:hypothetical protein
MHTCPPQTKSYMRGVLVRSFGSKTRDGLLSKLHVDPEVTLHLRSFLDRPKTRGSTRKGSGEVNYAKKAKTNTRTNIKNIRPPIANIIQQHMHSMRLRPHNYTTEKAILINKRISINGTPWNTNTDCEYYSDHRNGDMTELGEIQDFIVMKYKHKLDNNADKEGIFVRLKQYKPRPIKEHGVYVIKKTHLTHIRIIQVAHLVTLMTRVKPRRVLCGVPNPDVTTTYNLVPVCHAYNV